MKVWVQRWIESEQGWGQRPDGVSIHFSLASHKQYTDAYWAAMEIKHGSSAPGEYSFENGRPIEMVFNAEHADEHILAKALKGNDWRDWENYPDYLKKVTA